MAATTVLVDVVLDDSEENEVGNHDYQSDEPGDGSDHGGQKRTEDAGAESEEEGDECETAGDGVEDHNPGQCFGGIGGCGVEICIVNRGHYVCGVVADVFASAVVLVGAGWRNIKHTMPKCPECNTRMSDIALVGEHNLHDRDITDDWRRDGGDQQQDSSCKKEEAADMVENSSFGHCDGCWLRSAVGCGEGKLLMERC